MRFPPEHQEPERLEQLVLLSMDWPPVTVAASLLALLPARTIAKPNACRSLPVKKALTQST